VARRSSPPRLGRSQATDQLAGGVVLAEDGELVGRAGVTQPGTLLLQSVVDRLDVATALVAWLLATADGPSLRIEVFDNLGRQAVTAARFQPSSPAETFYGHREVGLQAAVDHVSAPPAAGYEIRGVAPDEAEQRVAVHGTAWKPSELPFNPDHRPTMDPEWTSSYYLEKYRRVQQTWLYESDLDLVAVAPDGSLAACCIGWFDATPVGPKSNP